MKKLSRPKKILVIIASVIGLLVLVVSVFLISVSPGPETDDMLFDVGMFNPISFFAFDGYGYVSRVVGNDDTFNVPSMLNVSFEPSGRTKWHTHDGGQVLICSYGTGYYQVEGEAPQILRVGDVVMIEPGIKHWHGAGADGWFSHITMSIGSPANHF